MRAGRGAAQVAHQVDEELELVGLECLLHLGVVTSHATVLAEQLVALLGGEKVPLERPHVRIDADVPGGWLAGEEGGAVLG